MNTKQAVQELKSERVQEELMAEPVRKELLFVDVADEPVWISLKAERVQAPASLAGEGSRQHSSSLELTVSQKQPMTIELPEVGTIIKLTCMGREAGASRAAPGSRRLLEPARLPVAESPAVMEAAGLTKEHAMNEQSTVQKLKAEGVQEESLTLMRKRVLGQGDPVGSAMAVSRNQAAERLKAERVQTRLKRLQGWKMLGEGKAIDRLRKFEDPLVAAAYLAFASLLARQARQPLRVSVVGGNIVIALTGRAKGPDKGLTEEVLDLAEQLG